MSFDAAASLDRSRTLSRVRLGPNVTYDSGYAATWPTTPPVDPDSPEMWTLHDLEPERYRLPPIAVEGIDEPLKLQFNLDAGRSTGR